MPALLFVLLLIQLLFVINAPWIGDYWEHRAVLNELILHPGNPSHPILASDQPHAFFSPYLVALGWLGHYLHLSSAQLLSLAAIGNLLLFMVSIRLLVGMFLPAGNRTLQFAATMLAVLFCWGYDPPNYSSFYHFGTLFYTTPYPSTFSFILSVFSATIFRYLLYHALPIPVRLLLATGTLILLTTVLLTHPLTFLFAISLLVAVGVQAAQDQTTSLFRITVSTLAFSIVPFAIASFWPYYPFFELLTYVAPGNRFHADSRELYSSLYIKLLPIAVLVFLAAAKPVAFLKNNLPVLMALFMLSVFFFYGFFSGSYGFGRMIAFIALLAQVLLVKELLEGANLRLKLLVPVLILLCMAYAFTSLKQIIQAAFKTRTQYLNTTVHEPFELTPPAELAHRLRFLENKVANGSLVLTDTACGRYLPGFGIRVIATQFPIYWIPENEQRLMDLKKFFYTGTATEKIQILAKYKPDYLLLTPSTRSLLNKVGENIKGVPHIESNGLLLIRLTHETSPQTNN